LNDTWTARWWRAWTRTATVMPPRCVTGWAGCWPSGRLRPPRRVRRPAGLGAGRRRRPAADLGAGRQAAVTGWAWPGTWPSTASRSPRSTAPPGPAPPGRQVRPIDAIRAARELLARPHPAQPRADGDREALRLLMIDRGHAVQSAKTARAALAAILVTAPPSCANSSATCPLPGGPAPAPR